MCIPQAVPTQWRELVERGIEQALHGASTDLDIVKRDQDQGKFTVSSGAWQNIDAFREYIFDSPVADIARALLQTQRLTLFYDFLLIKEARSNTAATPWHQDHSYYPLDGRQVINCWVALDDIPSDSAVRFLRGSHQAGTLFRAIDFDDPSRDYRHARKGLPLPPSDLDNDGEVLTTSMAAGDMLVWTSYTLHGAPGNSLDRRRAAFSTNWLGDDVRFNGEAALDTYLDATQVVGEPIMCEKFPLVRGQ